MAALRRLRTGAATLLAALAALAALPGTALAIACSPYQGQVVFNEVRIGNSNGVDLKNQIELFNIGGVPSAVWQAWTIKAYGGNSLATAVLKGSYLMSSGFTANGAFIYNNITKLWARNGDNNSNPRASDFAVFDANGAIVAYIAIGVGVQTVPACFGAATTIPATAGGDNTGDAMRAVDATGAWPAVVPKISYNTIGRTNACAAAGDLVVNIEADTTKAILTGSLTTTVNYTVTVFNNACNTNVAGVKIATTNTNASYLSNLATTKSTGSVSLISGGSGHLWNVGTVNSGVSETFTISGKPVSLGALTSTASVNAPTSGLINLADDTDTVTVTVYDANYTGFTDAVGQATEGTNASYSAYVALYVRSASPVTVNYSVSGTATATDTNLTSTGSLVIAAGVLSGPIYFTITNDTYNEPTKTIVLTITSVTSADTTVKIGTAANNDILVSTITLYDDDPPDHYELVLPSSSLACLASTVTVNACVDSSSPCTRKADGVNGATITLGTSAGTLGATSLSFNAAGVASTTLSYGGASNGASAQVTLSGPSVTAANSAQCCPDGVSCAIRNFCDSVFSTAGFIIAASAGGGVATLPTQTGGTASGTYYLRAVKTSTTTQACESAITGSTSVNWALQCNNPTTCATATPLTLTGNSATAVAGNPNTGVTTTTAVAMTFDINGNAPFSFNYADVGQITLSASKAAGGSLLSALSGSSNAFVVKPAGFALSAIQQTASPFLANPAAASAADAKLVKAGESFSVTVTALTSGGAASPNFGRETTAEGVLLTPALVLPASGVAGTLANATIPGASFAGGVATVSSLAYSEVGIITLTPSVASGSYLGAGIVSGSSSANIGRFYPSQFALTTGTPVPACSASFTYFGQDGFTTPFTLTAKNTAGATTQNYAGSFAKLGLGSWSNFVFSSASLPSGSSLAASATAPSGSWALGAAAMTAKHQVSRPTLLTGETSIVVKTAPVDSDGVTLGSTAVGAGTPLRWGRLRLSNAYGSASAALQVPVVAEYWSGNSWVLNSSDNCTVLAAASVVQSNPRTSAGNTSSATSSASGFTLASGSGFLTLTAPSPAGSSLSLDLALNLGATTADQSCVASHPASTGAAKPWLRSFNGSCSGLSDRDPGARASFGIYGAETRKTVHVRDMF